jgi:hypothetical protein
MEKCNIRCMYVCTYVICMYIWSRRKTMIWRRTLSKLLRIITALASTDILGGFKFFFVKCFVYVCTARVTRLGEFSAIGLCLLWQVFFNYIPKWSKCLGYIFPCKSYPLILTKNGFGYILDDFLTKSSGHRGAWPP